MKSIKNLLAEKEKLMNELKNISYGSIEIRNVGNKEFLYVHFRDLDGKHKSKYVAPYSTEERDNIIKNNLIAKSYKKRIAEIKKQLKDSKYSECELPYGVRVNIDLARKQIVNSIYDQSILEGIATTYSNTETIIEGGKVSGMNVDDITKTLNLKRAWEFILDEGVIQSKTDFNILCSINEIVEDGFTYTAGELRTVPVTVSGSTYKPPLPIESVIKESLDNILMNNNSIYEKSIDILLYTMRTQAFIDGNKRTAVIIANHFLIQHGAGLITIPAELVPRFKKLLVKFYETNDDKEIKKFLMDNCLTKLK